MKPAGRWTVASFGSSQLQALLLFWVTRFSVVNVTETSGCPPACGVEGIAEKEVIGELACAAPAPNRAAHATAAKVATARSLRPRRPLIALLPIGARGSGGASDGDDAGAWAASC